MADPPVTPISPAPAISGPCTPARGDLLLVALLGIILFFPFLGLRNLWTSGEARVAQVARQMRMPGGSWIIPELGDDERLKKPPLAYWLCAIASLPYDDVDEWNSRLPSAAAGVGLLLFIYAFGCTLCGRRAGLLAAFAAGSTSTLWIQARTTGIEMPLLFLNTGAIYAWWRSLPPADSDSTEIKNARWLPVCYLFLGFSMLQKGPIGPLLLLATALVFLSIARGWAGFFKRIHLHLIGMAILLAIALPWPLAVLHEMPDAWDIWFQESAGRYEGFDHLEPWYYFIPTMLGDGQPWVLIALLAPGLFLVKPDQEWQPRRSIIFLLTWVVVTLLFFSLPSSKKAYYILPVYPAVALLAGAVVDATLRMRDEQEQDVPALRWLFLIAGGLLLFVGIAMHPLWHGLPELGLYTPKAKYIAFYKAHTNNLITAAVILIFSGYALLRAVRERKYLQCAWVLFTCMVFGFGLMISFTPWQNTYKGEKDLGVYIREEIDNRDALLYTYDVPGRPLLIYYTSSSKQIQHLERLHELAELQSLVRAPQSQPVYVLTRSRHLRKFAGDGPADTPDPDLAKALEPIGHPDTPDGRLWVRVLPLDTASVPDHIIDPAGQRAE